MKTLALYIEGFSDSTYSAFIRILDLMATKYDFDYQIVEKSTHIDLAFFENTIPKDFPKETTTPQIVITDGSTYAPLIENQHRIPWGALEQQIHLMISVIRHTST